MRRDPIQPPVKYPYEYDAKRRAAAEQYTRSRNVHSLTTQACEFIVLGVLVWFGIAWLVPAISGIPGLVAAVFLFLLFLTIVRLPVHYLTGYVMDKRYELVAQTAASWLKDYGKEILVGLVVMVPLLTATYLLIGFSPQWWALAASLSIAVNLFMNLIFPVVIFPFLYKTEPFTDGKQRERLLEMVRTAGVKHINRVLVAKESEKSVRANAFFAGIGKTKSIVLYDNLLTKFDPRETESVVAHELGHYVHHDNWRFILIEALVAFPVFFLVDWFLGLAAEAGMMTGKADVLGLPIFLLTFAVLEFIAAPFVNAYSRHREARADWFALQAARDPVAVASTEKRLADQNLVADRLNRFWLWLFASHPVPAERVKMAEHWGRLYEKPKKKQ